MAVVTISGQVGCGAHEIGRLAAQRMGIDYVDQEILVEAARELGVPVESVVSRDERTATLGERLADMLRRFLERSAAASAADPMMGNSGLDAVLGRTYGEAAGEEPPEISDERYLETLSSIIRDLADHGNVLIIGRGSQAILRDWPGALHILLVAPEEQRVRYLAPRAGITEDEAAKRVHDGGRGRAAFHHKFFKIDVDDPTHYHLTLNTAGLPPEKVAQLIGQAAQPVAAQGAPP